MPFDRRQFLTSAAALGATLAAPMVARAQTAPHVVVIGGGAGGATAARYIATGSNGAINVTLVEPTRAYYTCFFSNLYLGGFREMNSLGHSYGTLASNFGINVVHDWAVGVDRDAKSVSLAGGGSLSYDRLVLSPGIDFIEDSVPGWSQAAQNAMPHAYKAGSQTELLKAQVMNMREGGVFAMIAPPNPYRCPPGPYERVSMVAHLLKQNNPTAKILIVDPKESFSKQGLFEDGWQRHYTGMIERIGPDFGATNVSVDPDAMTVSIDGNVEQVDVCNVIPAQRAGRIAHLAGITDGNWAPVSAYDLSSKMDKISMSWAMRRRRARCRNQGSRPTVRPRSARMPSWRPLRAVGPSHRVSPILAGHSLIPMTGSKSVRPTRPRTRGLFRPLAS